MQLPKINCNGYPTNSIHLITQLNIYKQKITKDNITIITKFN